MYKKNYHGYEEDKKTYTIVDVNDYSKKELLEDESVISKFLVIEKSKSNEELIENLEEVIEKTKKENLYKIEKIVDLVYSKSLGEEKTNEILEKIEKKRGEKGYMLERVADMVKREIDNDRKKARKEGRAEGRVEGRKEAKTEVAKKLIKEGFKFDLVYRTTGLEKNKLQELFDTCK